MSRRPSHAAVASLALAFFVSTARAQSGPAAAADPAQQTYAAAREHYDQGRLAEAISGFEAVLTDHRDHQVSVYAAELLLDSLNRTKDYQRMGEWVERLLADQKFLAAAPDLAGRLRLIGQQLLRKRAEELERSGDYEACAKTYLEIHSRYPGAQRSDEILYNAGVCFEAAKALGASITAFSQLLKLYPRSRLASRTMIRLGHTYHSMAFYEQAAEFYERYARTYAGEKDARDALVRAIELRRAMGETKRVRALSQLYVKMYSRKNVREASLVAYSAIPADEDGARAAISGLEEFLKRWGRNAPDELVLIANARLGALLWEQSCTKSDDPSGACVRTTKVSGKQRCMPGRDYRVLARNRRMAERGRKALEHAVAIYTAMKRDEQRGSGPAAPLRIEAARAHAKARFYLAEADYEEYLGLGFPTELSFDPRKPKQQKESTRRLREWMDKKRALHAKLTGAGGYGSNPPGAYREIAALKGAAGPWAAAAAARTAQTTLAFYESFATAEIPADVRTGEYAADKTRAFCDELQRTAAPVSDTAKAALLVCVERADTERDADRWVALCRKELEARWPVEFPSTQEIFATAYPADPVTDLAPLAAHRSRRNPAPAQSAPPRTGTSPASTR